MPPVTDPSSALGKSWRHSLRVETREQAKATPLPLRLRLPLRLPLPLPMPISMPLPMPISMPLPLPMMRSVTRCQAEAALAALGSEWEWLPGEMLRTVSAHPNPKPHPNPNQEITSWKTGQGSRTGQPRQLGGAPTSGPVTGLPSGATGAAAARAAEQEEAQQAREM